MSTPSQAEVRRMIAAAGTIVVKVGSSSLTQPSGHLDPDKLDALAAALAQVRLMGGRVVLVSSGAIAAGFGPLGFDSRPVDVATQQATAAVGQGLLMARYETAFGRFGIRVGQILIAAEDTIRATQYRNVERTLDRLLDLGVVPIIQRKRFVGLERDSLRRQRSTLRVGGQPGAGRSLGATDRRGRAVHCAALAARLPPCGICAQRD